jgi:hypothetical protein
MHFRIYWLTTPPPPLVTHPPRPQVHLFVWPLLMQPRAQAVGGARVTSASMASTIRPVARLIGL